MSSVPVSNIRRTHRTTRGHWRAMELLARFEILGDTLLKESSLLGCYATSCSRICRRWRRWDRWSSTYQPTWHNISKTWSLQNVFLF